MCEIKGPNESCYQTLMGTFNKCFNNVTCFCLDSVSHSCNALGWYLVTDEKGKSKQNKTKKGQNS